MADCLTVAMVSACVVDPTTAGADILQVNRSCADALGYDRETLLGKALEVSCCRRTAMDQGFAC